MPWKVIRTDAWRQAWTDISASLSALRSSMPSWKPMWRVEERCRIQKKLRSQASERGVTPKWTDDWPHERASRTCGFVSRNSPCGMTVILNRIAASLAPKNHESDGNKVALWEPDGTKLN